MAPALACVTETDSRALCQLTELCPVRSQNSSLLGTLGWVGRVSSMFEAVNQSCPHVGPDTFCWQSLIITPQLVTARSHPFPWSLAIALCKRQSRFH